jgi:cytochrome bd ubiquinol oxidase subunit II
VAYSFIGAAWVIAKTDGALQVKAITWARDGLWGIVLGMGAVSLATPFVSDRLYDKWFSWPQMLWLSPLPILSVALIGLTWWVLRRLPLEGDRLAWVPFAATSAVFSLGFAGMAYSFYPFVVPEAITIYEAAAAPESLWIILVGTLIVLPMIAAYSAFSYFIFRGKATHLRYD